MQQNRVVSLMLKESMCKNWAGIVLCCEMRVLRMMCGKTRREEIGNETICELAGLEKIQKFLREPRLRWFGHVGL